MAQGTPKRRFAITPSETNSPARILGLFGSSSYAYKLRSEDFFGSPITAPASGGGGGTVTPTAAATVGTTFNTQHGSQTVNANIPVGTTCLIINGGAVNNVTRTISSVTVNGSATGVTAIGYASTSLGGGNVVIQYAYYLLNPPTGASVPVVVTYSGNEGASQVTVRPYSGVNQTTPIEGWFHSGLQAATSGTKSYAPTTTTVSGDYLLGLFVEAGNSVESLDTELGDSYASNENVCFNCADSASTGAGNTLDWTDDQFQDRMAHIFAIKAAAGGGSTQNLVAGLLTNTQSFFPANVTVGAVTLTPPLLGSSNSFPAPTVTAGAMNVAPPLLTNSNTLYGGLVTLQPLSLLPPLLGSSNTLFAPTVTAGAMQVDAPLLTNTNILYTGIVANSQPLFPPLLSNSNSLFEPTVTLTVDLLPPLLTNSNSFPAATVTAGAMNVAPPLLTNTGTAFAPVITLDNNLAAPLLDNSGLNAVYSPSTSLAPYVATPPLLVNSTTFLAPTVTGTGLVVPPLLTNTQSFFGASITTGAATIVPQIVANQQTFFVATVTGGTPSDTDGGMYSVIERRRRQHSRQYRR